jgi:hypothetical protein
MNPLKYLRVLPLALIALALITSSASASNLAGLTFDASFATGTMTPFQGAQCANTGVASANYHQRGNFYVENSITGDGGYGGRIDLPANVAPYSTSVCEALHSVPVALGSDQYYGSMFYVPVGWDTGTKAFWGVQVAQYHFTNVWGSPIAFQLHDDHMTLALETGACSPVGSALPGCQYRSQADLFWGPNLPGAYVIPRGSMPQGHWYEIVLHVHWASNSTGQIQTWFRQKGQTAWTQSTNLTGLPTVQWTTGHLPATTAVDKIGAYRGYSTAPVSVWFDDITSATSFNAVTAAMP